MHKLKQDTPGLLLQYRQPVVVLLVGVLLATLASMWVARQVDSQVEERFQRLSERQNERIQERFELYALGLRGTRGIFLENPEGVSPKDFLRYTLSRDILTEFPGSLGWSYVERLRAGDVTGHLQKRHGLQYRRLDGRSLPEDEAWVVRLIAPSDSNSSVLGLDIRSEKNRHAAALASMQSGKATLSAAITLMQESLPGLLMTLPVHSGEAIPENVSGWVSVIMSCRDALGFLNDEPGLADQAAITISDITTGVEPLYRLPASKPAVAVSGSRLRTLPKLYLRTEMVIAGRRWEVQYNARPGIYTEADRWLPALSLALGTLLSFLVSGMLLFSTRLRLIAEQRAQTITASLREREALLQSTLSSLNDWVFVLDANGVVRDCHEPAQQSGWQTRDR